MSPKLFKQGSTNNQKTVLKHGLEKAGVEIGYRAGVDMIFPT